jgi:integrase
MTRLLFDEIIEPDHGYTFHSFRHSAANHLAIAWLGSKEMVMTYTDYSWQQAKSCASICSVNRLSGMKR